jgi:TolA-binding protein
MKIKQLTTIFIVILITGCDIFKSAEDLYSEAEAKRNTGDSKEALVTLKKIINKFSEHEKASKAQYLIAEIYYRDLRDFSKAINEYGMLRQKYPESPQVPFSLFMQGFIYANMLSNFEKARNHYEEFLNKFSNHELAQSVEFELKYLGIEIQEIPELKHLIK